MFLKINRNKIEHITRHLGGNYAYFTMRIELRKKSTKKNLTAMLIFANTCIFDHLLDVDKRSFCCSNYEQRKRAYLHCRIARYLVAQVQITFFLPELGYFNRNRKI